MPEKEHLQQENKTLKTSLNGLKQANAVLKTKLSNIEREATKFEKIILDKISSK